MQTPTAMDKVRVALAAGPATYAELQALTGLLMVTVKQAVYRLREEGLLVSETGGYERCTHRLTTREERDAFEAKTRCALQGTWHGVKAA